MAKSREAFRTISEVAEWLDTPAHVLRFWESKFSQVKPVKRAGGRRYYRPSDMQLLGGIKKLLHDDGLTIKGVQKLLREHGVKHVAALSQALDEDIVQEADFEEAPEIPPVQEEAQVLDFKPRPDSATTEAEPQLLGLDLPEVQPPQEASDQEAAQSDTDLVIEDRPVPDAERFAAPQSPAAPQESNVFSETPEIDAPIPDSDQSLSGDVAAASADSLESGLDTPPRVPVDSTTDASDAETIEPSDTAPPASAGAAVEPSEITRQDSAPEPEYAHTFDAQGGVDVSASVQEDHTAPQVETAGVEVTTTSFEEPTQAANAFGDAGPPALSATGTPEVSAPEDADSALGDTALEASPAQTSFEQPPEQAPNVSIDPVARFVPADDTDANDVFSATDRHETDASASSDPATEPHAELEEPFEAPTPPVEEEERTESATSEPGLSPEIEADAQTSKTRFTFMHRAEDIEETLTAESTLSVDNQPLASDESDLAPEAMPMEASDSVEDTSALPDADTHEAPPEPVSFEAAEPAAQEADIPEPEISAPAPTINVPELAEIAPQIDSFDDSGLVLTALTGARRIAPDMTQELSGILGELRELRDRMRHATR